MANNLAYYIRLSLADGDLSSFKDESNSIKNQRDLLIQYIESHEEFTGWNILEFVDDGYTGTNTDRPDFQKLMELTRQGQIQCIIVKDLSRFARNYVVCGEYIEEIFPFLGVRFIAVNDNYDSANGNTVEDNMSMVLKSVLNAYYSKDISRKIAASFHQRMRNGTFRCQAPFGYRKGEVDNRFIVDPPAASTVRLIFDLALAGKSLREICDELNEKKLSTPAIYNKQHIASKRNQSRTLVDDPLWEPSKVRAILRNRTYAGDMVMRKQVSVVPGLKKRRPSTPEEQFLLENAHPGIITHEEYDKVQKLLPARKTYNRSRNPMIYPLKGAVRCGYCKRSMSLQSKKTYFICRHATLTHATCSTKQYEQTELENLVYECLKSLIQLAITSEAAHRKRGNTSSGTQLLLQCQRDIANAEAKERKYKQLKLDLYEEYTSGTLTREAYMEKREAVIKDAKENSSLLEQLKTQEEAYHIGIIPHDVQAITDASHKYQHNTSLSREMVTCFLESIYCYEDHYEIKWKYQNVWNQLMKQADSDTESNASKSTPEPLTNNTNKENNHGSDETC